MDEINHGSTHAYVNKGCRCDTCRAAFRAYREDLRERRLNGEPRRAKSVRNRSIHGTTYGYQLGCRCDPCRSSVVGHQAASAARRRARAKVDPSIIPHGKPSTMKNYGCTCDDCLRAAGRRYKRVPL